MLTGWSTNDIWFVRSKIIWSWKKSQMLEGCRLKISEDIGIQSNIVPSVLTKLHNDCKLNNWLLACCSIENNLKMPSLHTSPRGLQIWRYILLVPHTGNRTWLIQTNKQTDKFTTGNNTVFKSFNLKLSGNEWYRRAVNDMPVSWTSKWLQNKGYTY